MPELIIQQVECIAVAEGQPITISFETSIGTLIDFDSSLNESDMTGMYDGDANKYDSDPNDNNNKNEIEIPHYYYPFEEHNDHRGVIEDENKEFENNNDDLQESCDSRMSEDNKLSTRPESFNVKRQDQEEYDINGSSITISSFSSHAPPSENTRYKLRANTTRD